MLHSFATQNGRRHSSRTRCGARGCPSPTPPPRPRHTPRTRPAHGPPRCPRARMPRAAGAAGSSCSRSCSAATRSSVFLISQTHRQYLEWPRLCNVSRGLECIVYFICPRNLSLVFAICFPCLPQTCFSRAVSSLGSRTPRYRTFANTSPPCFSVLSTSGAVLNWTLTDVRPPRMACSSGRRDSSNPSASATLPSWSAITPSVRCSRRGSTNMVRSRPRTSAEPFPSNNEF